MIAKVYWWKAESIEELANKKRLDLI